MKHILPVLALILSIFNFCMSALCLVLMCIVALSSSYAAIAAFVVPALFLTVALTALSLGTNFAFMKHRFCLVGFIISCVDVAVIIAVFVIMFAF